MMMVSFQQRFLFILMVQVVVLLSIDYYNVLLVPYTSVNAFTTTTTTTTTTSKKFFFVINRHRTFHLTNDGSTTSAIAVLSKSSKSSSSTQLFMGQISDKRRKELGIQDNEDEYDLDVALNNNTDPLITKIIAGSFIITMIALLVIGLVIPLTGGSITGADTEGLCNPLLKAGRC